MLKAVIFDVDGTLFDSVDQHAHAWQDAFAHFGFDFAFDPIRQQIGKGGDKLLDVFLDTFQRKSIGLKIEQYRAERFKAKYLASCKPFPKTRDLLQSLRQRGLRIALGSSGKKTEIETYMKLLEIDDLVDQSISSDDVENSKPDPDVIAAARQKLGDLSPQSCCFIGDSPHDAAAAKKDGTAMIGVLCGGFPEEDLRSAGASAIYRDPADLLQRWIPI